MDYVKRTWTTPDDNLDPLIDAMNRDVLRLIIFIHGIKNMKIGLREKQIISELFSV